MLELQPLWETWIAFVYDSLGWQPPRTNDMIFCLSVVHYLYIIVVFAYLLVLKLHGVFDILLSYLVEIGKPSLNRQIYLWFSIKIVGSPHIINLGDRIPISLSNVYHETFEDHIGHSNVPHGTSFFQIKICAAPSSNCMSQHTTHNSQHFTMLPIIYTTCHCRLVLQTLHIVKHYPRIFHDPSNLHTFYKLYTIA